MVESYSFDFIKTDYKGTDDWLKCTLVYQFVSAKSNHLYVVRVESYVEHLYCIKFYDATTSKQYEKFSQRSGTYEPRRIFRTIAAIAMDVLQKDKDASFFFIGAADENDQRGKATKRYVVYSQFVKNTTAIPSTFEHFAIEYLSMYVLVNREAVQDMNAYVQRILDFADSIQ